MKTILWLLWAVVAVCVGAVCAWVWFTSYTIALEQIIAFLHIPDKREQLATQILTPARFEQVRWALLLALCVVLASSLCVSWVARQASLLVGKLQEKLQKCRQAFRRERWFWLILAVGGLPIVWRVFVYGYWIDEIFTYVFLVKKGLLVSLTYYPGPNNHVFFTAIGAVLGSLPLMRLASCLAVWLTACLLFVWVGKHQGRQVARWVVLIFLWQSPVQMYGYLARGYAWEMLFFALLWIGLYEWTRTQEKVYLVIASLASIAGFYTLPTFVYAYSALLLVALFSQKRKEWKFLFISQAIVVLIVLVLYLPIILLNGVQALVGNAWLQVGKDVFWRDLSNGAYWAEIVGFWGFELPVWGAWIVLCLWITCLFCAVGKMRLWLLGAVFVPVVWLLYQQILPPVRVWSYQVITLALAVAWCKESTLQTFLQYLFALLAGVSLAMYWQFLPASPAYEAWAKRIVAQKATSVFSNDDTYQMYIRYEYALRDLPVDIQTTCLPQQREFEIVILSNTQKVPACILPTAYELLFENAEVKIYKRLSTKK